MLVLVGGGVLVGRICWKRLRHRHRQIHRRLDPLARRRGKLLARMDRRLARQALVRAPRETLHQFASRLGAHTAAWYRHFAVALHTGSLDLDTLEDLALHAHKQQSAIPDQLLSS